MTVIVNLLFESFAGESLAEHQTPQETGTLCAHVGMANRLKAGGLDDCVIPQRLARFFGELLQGFDQAAVEVISEPSPDGISQFFSS